MEWSPQKKRHLYAEISPIFGGDAEFLERFKEILNRKDKNMVQIIIPFRNLFKYPNDNDIKEAAVPVPEKSVALAKRTISCWNLTNGLSAGQRADKEASNMMKNLSVRFMLPDQINKRSALIGKLRSDSLLTPTVLSPKNSTSPENKDIIKLPSITKNSNKKKKTKNQYRYSINMYTPHF